MTALQKANLDVSIPSSHLRSWQQHVRVVAIRASGAKKPLFSCEGEIALMFLKSYNSLSDDGLIEMLNGSIHMQMFCDALIDPSCPIRDGKIVSAIRNRLAPSS